MQAETCRPDFPAPRLLKPGDDAPSISPMKPIKWERKFFEGDNCFVKTHLAESGAHVYMGSAMMRVLEAGWMDVLPAWQATILLVVSSQRIDTRISHELSASESVVDMHSDHETRENQVRALCVCRRMNLSTIHL